MRDMPYIFIFMTLFIAVFILGGVWYATDINEDSAVGDLNTITRTTAINHVSLASRVDPGMVYFDQEGLANFSPDNPDFETSLLKELDKDQAIPAKSIIRIDYVLTDKNDIVATEYTMTGRKADKKTPIWKATDLSKTTPKARPLALRDPVDAIRVRYRKDGHQGNSSTKTSKDYWSYQSTIEVSRSKDIEKIMEENKES